MLLAGFRSAGWACFSAAAVALVISFVGMRGAGLVGQEKPTSEEDKASIEKHAENIEMESLERRSSNGAHGVNPSSTHVSSEA